MIGIVLTLVFGSVIFYLYNRLSMTERKMGLFEGVLTDLKIMMDSAPFASGPPPMMREFEPTPEYLNAISGPLPLQKEEVEEVSSDEDYQQTLEQALERASGIETSDMKAGVTPYRTLQIDETPGVVQMSNSINVTKLSPDLDSMTVKELLVLAKQSGVSVPAGTRRKDLIELIKGASSPVQSSPLQATEEVELTGPEPSNAGASIDVTV